MFLKVLRRFSADASPALPYAEGHPDIPGAMLLRRGSETAMLFGFRLHSGLRLDPARTCVTSRGVQNILERLPESGVLEIGMLQSAEIASQLDAWEAAHKPLEPTLKAFVAEQAGFMRGGAANASGVSPRALQSYLFVTLPYAPKRANGSDEQLWHRECAQTVDDLATMCRTHGLGELMDLIDLVDVIDQIRFPAARVEARRAQRDSQDPVASLRAALEEDTASDLKRVSLLLGKRAEESSPADFRDLLISPNNWGNGATLSAPYWVWCVVQKPGDIKRLAKPREADAMRHEGMVPVLIQNGITLQVEAAAVKETVKRVEHIAQITGMTCSPIKESADGEAPGLPGNGPWPAAPRGFTLASSQQVLPWVPIESPWNGDGALTGSGLLVSTPGGHLTTLDMTSSMILNTIVAGQAGCGKSTVISALITERLARDGAVRVLDVGGTHRRLCGLVKGDHITLKADAPISFNVFWGFKSRESIEARSEGLCALLISMAMAGTESRAEQSEISGIDVMALTGCISASWLIYGDKLTPAGIADGLITRPSSRAMAITGQAIRTFLAKYGAWFEGPLAIGSEKSMAVLDFEEMVALRETGLPRVLRDAACVAYGEEFLMRRGFGAMSHRRPLTLAIEECWIYSSKSESDYTHHVLTWFARMSRKASAGLLLSLQDTRDLRMPSLRDLDRFFPWFLLFKQPPSGMVDATQRLDPGSSRLLNMVKGLKTTLEHSEFVVCGLRGTHSTGPTVMQQCHLYLSPYAKALLTRPETGNEAAAAAQIVKGVRSVS